MRSAVLSTVLVAAATVTMAGEGIWKAVVPRPGTMKGEFDNNDPIGLYAGVKIKADCSLNWTNPDDQGPDEAFILCTATDKLLHQFDTGPDVTITSVYGTGQGPFGSPEESIASAVFSPAMKRRAKLDGTVRASPHVFNTCDEIDRLVEGVREIAS